MIDLSLGQVPMSAVRELSRAVFGQEHKLAVILAIGSSDAPFTLTTLQRALDLPHASSIQRCVQSLLAARLIMMQPPSGADRARYYERNNSSLWQLGRELYEGLHDQEMLPFA